MYQDKACMTHQIYIYIYLCIFPLFPPTSHFSSFFLLFSLTYNKFFLYIFYTSFAIFISIPLLCQPELSLGRPYFSSSDVFWFCWAAFHSISLLSSVFPLFPTLLDSCPNA